MLRWVQTIEGFDGFCERCLVAEVGDMDGIFYWSLNISRRRNESNSGVEKSIEAAKAVAETAFRAWLDRAGLVPKLPIYELPASFVALEDAINEPPGIYDIEPVEVRSYRHSIYPKWQQVIRDTRAMLAAAPKPDSLKSVGTGKSLAGKSVEGDSHAENCQTVDKRGEAP